jgi:hypothetical protein
VSNFTRPGVAAICVELDISKTLPNKIIIGSGYNEFVQPILYPSLPHFCSKCGKVGHLVSNCWLSKPAVNLQQLSLKTLLEETPQELVIKPRSLLMHMITPLIIQPLFNQCLMLHHTKAGRLLENAMHAMHVGIVPAEIFH